MKKTYKYLITIAFNGLLCLFVAISANAQHRDGGGSSSSSSGGGSRSSGGSSSGGGSTSRPAPSGNSNSGGSFRPAPSNNNNNSYRPSVSNNNNNGARQSYNTGGGYNRTPGNNARVAIANPRFNNLGIRNPSYNVTPGYRAGVNATYNGNRSYVNSGTRGSVVGTSGYIGAGGRASVGVGGRGYIGPSYWRTNSYYHFNHGYYGTYYAPRLGFSIGFLPYGCYPFYFDDYQYYYSGGLFYQYENNEYTVVEPPVGAEVNSLPSNAQSIVINGQQYYEANGVYYEAVTKDDGSVTYQVAGKDGELNTNTNSDVQQAPQVGDLVESLPPDCRKISLNGERYYVSPDGYYYQEAKDANNNKVYKIVGTPDEAPSN